MARNLASILLLVACSAGPKPHPEPRPAPVVTSPELTPALAPLAWLLGDWDDSGSSQTWVAAGGTLYGVTFGATPWRVAIIDDGDGTSDTADGVRRYIDLDGWTATELIESADHGDTREFTAGGTTVVVEHGATGGLIHTVLRVEDGADHPTRVEDGYSIGRGAPAPALEDADRAFDADTFARGVDGWVAWFADDGALWRDERISGAVAIGDKLRGTLTSGHLRWQPIASRMHGDDLGFTVGTATWTANDATEPAWRGSYVTIWKLQSDGSWKVVFDTGRAQQPAAPAK